MESNAYVESQRTAPDRVTLSWEGKCLKYAEVRSSTGVQYRSFPKYSAKCQIPGSLIHKQISQILLLSQCGSAFAMQICSSTCHFNGWAAYVFVWCQKNGATSDCKRDCRTFKMRLPVEMQRSCQLRRWQLLCMFTGMLALLQYQSSPSIYQHKHMRAERRFRR